MIRAAAKRDTPLVGRLAQCAATGGALAAGFVLKQQNPRMPQHYYVADETTVLALEGAGLTVYGQVPDAEELALFLQMQRCENLLSADFVPPGWQCEELCEMSLAAAPVVAPGVEVDMAVPPGECCRLLWRQPGFPEGEAPRERLYSWLCSRVAHGYAHALGVWHGDVLVATALACGTPEVGYYLSDVYTQEACQGRGYATALVNAAAACFAVPRLWLMAAPDMAPFYARCGFVPAGRAVMAVAPKKEQQ